MRGKIVSFVNFEFANGGEYEEKIVSNKMLDFWYFRSRGKAHTRVRAPNSNDVITDDNFNILLILWQVFLLTREEDTRPISTLTS